jgi:hypothetical protein
MDASHDLKPLGITLLDITPVPAPDESSPEAPEELYKGLAGVAGLTVWTIRAGGFGSGGP